jgi:hypothetical protein
MSDDFRFIKRAEIKPEYQGPGCVRKILIDETGSHEFSRIVRLEIARNGTDGGFYLFHTSADGNSTDTWHETIEEAFGQAAEEYGVSWDEWQEVS